jgi:hypothetical protein
MFFTSSWGCVLHYTTFTGTSFRTGPYRLFFLSFTYALSIAIAPGKECLLGFLMSLSMTAKGRRGEEVSTGMRANQGNIMSPLMGRRDKQQSSLAFFDDKYVR